MFLLFLASGHDSFIKMASVAPDRYEVAVNSELKGSMKEPNKFHNYETEKITRKASDAAEYIELFGSFTRDRHARCI